MALNGRLKQAVAKAKVPEELWDRKTYPDHQEYLEPFSTGLAEGIIKEVGNIPLLISLIVDYTTDDTTRNQINDAIAGMDIDAIIDGFVKERKELYNGNNPYKIKHRTGRDVVEAGTMLGTGGIAALGKIKKGAELIREMAKRLKKGEGVKIPAKFANFEMLLSKLDEIEASAPGSRQRFLDDFADASDDVVKKLGDNPDLIDSWNSLKKAGFDDLARNTDNLDALNKALKQSDYDASYFENLLKSKSDPQKFIDDYVKKLGDDGKFLDDAFETNYQNYLTRKARTGKSPRDRADWNQASDHMKYHSPTARGNNFNDVGKLKYDINELNLVLEDGRFVRVDSYIPPLNGKEGVIISRKATDLVDISESTFRKHLQEMNLKYAPGTKIHSKKFTDIEVGITIEGQKCLELPASNKSFYDIERYKQIAQKEYGIEIIFLAE